MPILKCQIEFPQLSGIAEDTVVQTFVVNSHDASVPPSYAADVATKIGTMYNTAPDAGGGYPNAIGRFLARSFDRAANRCMMKFYDITAHLDGSPHGSPVLQVPWTLPAVGDDSSQPAETALAVTLRANNWEDQPVETPDSGDVGPEVDRPRARYSGRMYFGPFILTQSTYDAGWMSRPSDHLRNALAKTVVRFHQELFADGGGALVVWSRKDATVRDVADVQVDNAWDNQRRRGAQPTNRLTLAA